MKRVLCVALCIVLALAMCACTYNESGPNETQGNDGRITMVYSDGYCAIYRDNETGVHYLSMAGIGVCVLVNQDGTPYAGGVDNG